MQYGIKAMLGRSTWWQAFCSLEVTATCSCFPEDGPCHVGFQLRPSSPGRQAYLRQGLLVLGDLLTRSRGSLFEHTLHRFEAEHGIRSEAVLA